MALQETSSMLYRDWLTLRIHLLWCYDHAVVLPPEVDDVYHSDYETNCGAWLVRSGWAEVLHGGQTWRAEPGQWLVVRPGHRIQSFPLGTHLLSVSFEADWPDGTHLFEKGLPLAFDAEECPLLERKAKRIARSVATFSPVHWDAREAPVDCRQFLKLDSLLSHWLLTLADFIMGRDVYPTGRFGMDERVMKAVRLLDAHPLDERPDPEALARQAGLSLGHLMRLFQRHLRNTPHHYFERRRLDYARRRLGMSNVPIQDVAIGLGFNYLSHFSAWFKKHTGQSPRHYVKSVRPDKRR